MSVLLTRLNAFVKTVVENASLMSTSCASV